MVPRGQQCWAQHSTSHHLLLCVHNQQRFCDTSVICTTTIHLSVQMIRSELSGGPLAVQYSSAQADNAPPVSRSIRGNNSVVTPESTGRKPKKTPSTQGQQQQYRHGPVNKLPKHVPGAVLPFRHLGHGHHWNNDTLAAEAHYMQHHPRLLLLPPQDGRC
jgi:hypothetical protein